MELEIYPTFADFWNLYDKKVGRKELLAKKFLKLPYKDKMKIMETLPDYVRSTPDKQYRKNPETYLNNRSWEDEIIFSTKPKTIFEQMTESYGK